jgi:hypothetical protein
MTSAKQGFAEIVGVFRSAEAVETAVGELASAGWDRADMSLIGGKDLLPPDLGLKPTGHRESTDEPDSAPVVKDDLRQMRTLTTGMAGTVAAFLAAGATIMSGGATLVAIIGAAVAGGGAAALVEALGHDVDQQREELLHEQLACGGILLWVALHEPQEEAKARAILEKCGASDVQRHAAGDHAPDRRTSAR